MNNSDRNKNIKSYKRKIFTEKKQQNILKRIFDFLKPEEIREYMKLNKNVKEMIKINRYIFYLSEEQIKSVKYCKGRQLIIAGPGSGKTKVITHKIAYLVFNKKISPGNILALTFTKKAAEEMIERLNKLIGPINTSQLIIGTFHSVFLKFLRKDKYYIYASNFKIYEDSKRLNVINKILKENFKNLYSNNFFCESLTKDDYKKKEELNRLPKRILDLISKNKGDCYPYNYYKLNDYLIEKDKKIFPEEIYGNNFFLKCYEKYTETMIKEKASDFDDIISDFYYLIKENISKRNEYKQKIKYILVDEIQDTNKIQYEILEMLSEDHNNICAVGDDAQSIYGFRGSRIENICDFSLQNGKNSTNKTKIFTLSKNYRSLPGIVDAANELISKNKIIIKKHIEPVRKSKEISIILKSYINDEEEAEGVAKKISNLIKEKKCKFSDFSILYRTNEQSSIIQLKLIENSIKFKLSEEHSFLERKIIKDVLAYFYLVDNIKDDESFKRIINFPKRGLGNKFIEEISEIANLDNSSLYEIAVKYEHLNPNKKKGLSDFIRQFNLVLNIKDKITASQLAKSILEIFGIYKYLENSQVDKRLIDKLMKILENMETNFLNENISNLNEKTLDIKQEDKNIFLIKNFVYNIKKVSILKDKKKDKNYKSIDEEENNYVKVMTMHKSKGLEFKYNFIIGVEEGYIPLSSNINELEEERRLFYVAITRTKDKCFLSWCKFRYNNFFGEMMRSESRFIYDIPKDLMLEIKNDEDY